MHILIVEDDPDQYRAMRQTLERQGWTTDVATLPREALRKFDAHPPDLLLLDLSLADKRLSGYDVLSTIRNRPGGDDILIVILSGQKEPAEQVRGLRLGADDYWTKPMVPELLVERVLKVLSRRLQSVGPVKREWRQGDVLIRLANGKFVAIDGREMAPAAATRNMYVRNGRGDTELSQTGALASGVPGELAAFDYAIRRFGKKKLGELILPAAKIAEEGFAVSQG